MNIINKEEKQFLKTLKRVVLCWKSQFAVSKSCGTMIPVRWLGRCTAPMVSSRPDSDDGSREWFGRLPEEYEEAKAMLGRSVKLYKCYCC
uniref:Uncharacterized protein n=1 Tax=Ditylenchus dipsaci TaxID=166011 RepID=A0A915DLR9_9BILA